MGILVTSPRPFPPPPPAVPWPGVAAMRWLVPDLVPEGDAPEAHALNLLDPQARLSSRFRNAKARTPPRRKAVRIASLFSVESTPKSQLA